MNLKLRAAKNVGAMWLNLLVHAVVGFFLSPFILHRLGDELFSLWVLIFSLTGYCGILDLGIRTATVRYVAKCSEAGDQDQLARFLSTGLGFYCAIALLSLILTGTGYLYLPRVFNISPADLEDARLLFLIAGAGVALSFPLSLFSGVLEGLQKFDALGLTQVGLTLLRGLLIVIALKAGGKLLAIGGITVGMNLLSYIIFMCLARRHMPVSLSVRHLDGSTIREMLRYGVFAFVILVAEKLRFQSDAAVIGAFVSTAAIASFSMASKLVEYSTYAVRSMAQIFTPMSSQFHAARDFARLRHTLVAGNRACALIVFPLCIILIILGKSILEVWAGTTYVSSYPVLVMLATPRSIYLAQSTSTKILMGMGEHRTLAIVLLVEGVANVVLSILLVGRFGVLGVALGTAIPLFGTSLLFLPHHIARHLDMPLRTLLGRSYLLPAALCVPFAGALLFVRQEFPAHGYRGLILQLACGGLVYCVGLSFVVFSWVPRSSRSWGAVVQVLKPR
jgi:O-antigen/teichoic acid export membrane protein